MENLEGDSYMVILWGYLIAVGHGVFQVRTGLHRCCSVHGRQDHWMPFCGSTGRQVTFWLSLAENEAHFCCKFHHWKKPSRLHQVFWALKWWLLFLDLVIEQVNWKFYCISPQVWEEDRDAGFSGSVPRVELRLLRDAQLHQFHHQPPAHGHLPHSQLQYCCHHRSDLQGGMW